MLRHLAAASAIALVGCGSSIEPVPNADTMDFTHAIGIVPAGVDVDGVAGRLLVDSGSPLVLLDASAFPKAPQIGNVDLVVNRHLDFSDTPVVTAGQLTSPDPAVPIGGLLGCTVICGQRVSFDYEAGVFSLGPTVPSSDVGAKVEVPFSFEGGETLQAGGQTIDVPRSRIVVTVSIEGTDHPMIVDTGASAVTLRSSVFDALASDGRVTIDGPQIETVSGVSTSKLARVASIKIGNAEADGVVVLGDASTDMIFDSVASEVGHPIEGSLGGSFLGRFFTTIDYPNHRLELFPYDDPSFMVDSGHTLGFTVRPGAGGFLVDQVFPSTSAAQQGVVGGEVLKMIDGTPVTSLTASQLLVALSGSVGTQRQVAFADKTVKLQVAEVLPAP